MISNYYNYLSYFNRIILEAENYIKTNNYEALKKLVKDYDQLGTAIIHSGFNEPEPLFHTAIIHGRDDMALELYMANPNDVKQYMYKCNLNTLTIYTDILGDAVINRRYNLVKDLLDLKGKYEFDIDGVKITGNSLLNFYYVIDNGDNCTFRFGLNEDNRYITSPLLLSLLIEDWDMYEILKKRGAYFNKDNKDCKFHLDYCKNEKIKNDIYKSFKNKEEKNEYKRS